MTLSDLKSCKADESPLITSFVPRQRGGPFTRRRPLIYPASPLSLPLRAQPHPVCSHDPSLLGSSNPSPRAVFPSSCPVVMGRVAEMPRLPLIVNITGFFLLLPNETERPSSRRNTMLPHIQRLIATPRICVKRIETLVFHLGVSPDSDSIASYL